MEPTRTGLRHRARRVERQISTQHRHLNPLFEELCRAVGGESPREARAAYERFRDAIDAHFSLEDEFFFPALHGLCAERAGELSGLSRDHRRLLSELDQVERALDAGAMGEAARVLDSFAAALGAHEGREENLVAAINERG